jgi:SAM-dependent methyltransferase
VDELALYDLTRKELRLRLDGKFPSDFNLEDTLTAYAYWVCIAMRNHGKDWESALQEYVDLALSDALLESQAELAELDLLRRELRQCASPLLDVGAGWGRFGFLYEEFGLQAVYVEPSSLGCRLLRRNGFTRSVRCLGQLLGFPTHFFNSAVIGWVLHHDAPDVPAAAILGELARVLTPSGRLFSIEPLSVDFDIQIWRDLIESSGFEVKKLITFFETDIKSEQYAWLTAVRRLEH